MEFASTILLVKNKLIVLMYETNKPEDNHCAAVLYDHIFIRSPKPCLQHSGLIGSLVPGINLHAPPALTVQRCGPAATLHAQLS